MTLQDLMMLYGVTLGRRRTAREKYLFAQHLGERFPELGFPVQVQQLNEHFFKVENLIAGDLAKARVLFVAPFDTPAKAIAPCKYYPFHPEKTLREDRRDLILQLCAAAVLLLAAYVLASTGLAGAGVRRAALLAVAALVAGCGIWRLFNHSNRYNFNRCSASLAVMEKLAEDLKGNTRVAFAFCDRSVSTYEGYKLLKKNISGISAVVILDCIASGEKLAMAHSEYSGGHAERLKNLLDIDNVIDRAYGPKECERNVLALFPTGVFLAGGKVEKGEFVVENTRTEKDIALDLAQLEKIEHALAAFAKDEQTPKTAESI